MERRSFIKQSTLATAGLCLGATDEPGLIGHGNFKYRLNRNWCKGSALQFPVNNCHELVMSRSGKIFMTTDDVRNNILIFDKDGQITGAWGKEYPGAHGLTLHDENGDEFLYISDYERHQVIKTTLEGKVIQTFEWPADGGFYRSQQAFKPTETAIAPNGDVLVADGYGKDYVVHYDHKGNLINVFGGPDILKNAHGIAFDNRDKANPSWLVTSRAENKLKRFDLTGKLIEIIHLPGAYICRPVVTGEHVYFAVLISELPWDSQTGFVCILDKNNRVVSAPGARTPRYDSGGALKPLYQTVKAFKHPHDVLVDANGDIYVSQWNSGRVYPYRLEPQ
ncbi:MAG: 6-bladed beta-propeller [Saprospiraceae bacterium]|nr:6-bladed beta-propeller [Saprospiraceae bacterium]